MKFRCERDALSEAIGSAGRAVASRSGALPILSGLLVRTAADEIHLAGSDLELTIRVSAPAECDDDGAAVLPARLFGDIVRSLEPGAVSVDVGEDEARIESGRSKFSLRVLAADDFPRLPEVAGSGVRMDATALAEALRQVIPAASRDDARPILTGVLLVAEGSGLRLVATDSYRLGVRDLPGESVLAAHLSGAAAEGRHVLVPAKALGELQRLLGSGGAPGSTAAPGTENTVELSFSDRDACFDTGKARVSTRLIEGQFPNYQQLIPNGYPEPAGRAPGGADRGGQARPPHRPRPGQRPDPADHGLRRVSSSRRSSTTSARRRRSSTPSTRAPRRRSPSTPSSCSTASVPSARRRCRSRRSTRRSRPSSARPTAATSSTC